MSITIYLVSAASVASYIVLMKLLIPLIEKIVKYFANKKNKDTNEKLDVEKKEIDVEGDNSKLYQNQITFFISQIDILQNQLQRKSDEIIEMNLQCDELRSQLLAIQKELFEEKKKNLKLSEFYCHNENCINRIRKK